MNCRTFLKNVPAYTMLVFTIVVGLLALQAVCQTEGSTDTSDITASSHGTGQIAQTTVLNEGPVAILPVVFRGVKSTIIPGEEWFQFDPESGSYKSILTGRTIRDITAAQLKEAVRQDAMAGVARQLFAEMIRRGGTPVLSFADVDKEAKEIMPEYWTAEGREASRIQAIAAKTGAKRVVFLDMCPAFSYRRTSGLDILTYQLAAPEVMSTSSTLEVYDERGQPIGVFDAISQVPVQSSLEALTNSVLAIGISYYFVQLFPFKYAVPGSPGEAYLAQFAKDETFSNEIRARQQLLKGMAGACLGKSVPDITVSEAAKFELPPLVNSNHPLEFPISAANVLPMRPGSKICVLSASYPQRRSKTVSLGIDETGKYIFGYAFRVKELEKAEQKAVNAFNAEVIKRLTARCAQKGISVVAGGSVYHTGALQDLSSESLHEKCRSLGCDAIAILETKAIVNYVFMVEKWECNKTTVTILSVENPKAIRIVLPGKADRVAQCIFESLTGATR
jgi:hypothetical protein